MANFQSLLDFFNQSPPDGKRDAMPPRKDEEELRAGTPITLDQVDPEAISIIGKHDLNLALRACFVLNPKDTRRKAVRRFTVVDESGRKLELTYEVKAADRLPFYRDMETLMAAITLACRDG